MSIATLALSFAPEVYPALQTRMIDIVPASAIIAIAFQWHKVEAGVDAREAVGE